MKRALIYASVASMIRQFNMENIRLLRELGYEVDVACNMEQGSSIPQEKVEAMGQELTAMGIGVFHVPVPRKITALGQMFRSFRDTRDLLNRGNYTLVHCHSPIGGMLCRLANRCGRNYQKTKMLYTAHGFHFFQGAPKINWLLYYPVEKLCARFTDVLITINREDYARGGRFRLKKGGSVRYVPGIGVQTEALGAVPDKREALCRELGIPEGSLLMLSVGELNPNKNHRAVVQAMPELPGSVHYLICGQGAEKENLQTLARELGCGDRLHILGFRGDVPSVMRSCDLFVFPSKREGLSVALMEAMACGLPCFVSRIRGNSDLLEDAGGALLSVESFSQELAEQFRAIGDFPRFQAECREKNQSKIRNFDVARICGQMEEIYRNAVNE